MKKALITFSLLLYGISSFCQTWQNTGTANLQRQPTATGYIYRNNMGALGFVNWYTSHQVDSITTGKYVPYTGATNTLNLGNNLFNSSASTSYNSFDGINKIAQFGWGTGGGQPQFLLASGAISASLNPTNLFFSDGSHSITILKPTISTTFKDTLPSRGGTLALQTDTSIFVPKNFPNPNYYTVNSNLIFKGSEQHYGNNIYNQVGAYTLYVPSGVGPTIQAGNSGTANTTFLSAAGSTVGTIYGNGNGLFNSSLWTFGSVISPKLTTGNFNLDGFSLSGFYNSSANGNMLIGNNRSGGFGEIDFINAIGTSVSAKGGFHWSQVTTGGVEQDLLDINGNTKNITTYGQLLVGSIPASASVGNKYVTIDPTSGVLVYRTSAQVLTDATATYQGQVPLALGVATVTVSGLTTTSHAFVQIVTMNGTASTKQYTAVCTADTLTITAKSDDTTTNTSDTSVLNYFVIP